MILFLLICTLISVLLYCLQKWSRKKADAIMVPDHEKLVVISGCDTGFGRMLVDCLAVNTAYTIVALTLTDTACQEISDQYYGEGDSKRRVYAIVCDVTNPDHIENMKKEVKSMIYPSQHDKQNSQSKKKEGGLKKLYCIVNNAGIASGTGQALFFPTPDAHKNVMNVNYNGTIGVTLALQEFLVCPETAAPLPRIIYVSSVCGVVAMPGNSSYCASKAAVETFADCQKIELAPFGVQVVKVRPGTTKTGIQDAFVANGIKNFNSAPESIKELYGGDAWKKTFTEKVGVIKDYMSSPDVVVNCLKNIITHPYPRGVYWTGIDAKTLFRALSILPTAVVDCVMHVLNIGPEPKTKTLSVDTK